MPLPTKDSVAFRGVPPLGAETKMALSMTLTLKQVEAMFARQATLREMGSSQCPLEIDFDDNKIYIGTIATPFSRFKENGTREIYKRSPTVSKPLAGMSLSGNVVEKLDIQRDFDQDIADRVRKLTELEHSKRNERPIVRLDTPLVPTNGKKGKAGSGASTLAKKAISNRIASAQAVPNRLPGSIPASRPTTPTSSSSTSTSTRPKPPGSAVRPTPPSSRSLSTSSAPQDSTSSTTRVSGSATSRELDPDSLSDRLRHFVALDKRTTEQVLLELGGRNPSAETVREIEDVLTAVAQEVPQPKKGSSGPVLWELRLSSWEQVSPYEWPDLTPEERTRMARKGRLACGQMNIPPTDPLWERFGTKLSEINPPSRGKATAASTQSVKKADFKGGMFPKEKKASVKGGATTGGLTKPKAAAAKSKTKKGVEDKVEAKVRKVVDGLAAETKTKLPPGTVPTMKIPKKKHEEEQILPSSVKARSSLGSVGKGPSSLPPKPRRPQDDGAQKRRLAEIDTDSEMEEGELPVAPDAKKRKIDANGEPNKPRLSSKLSDNRDTSTMKGIRERERVSVDEESTSSSKVRRDANAVPRASVSSSSSLPKATTSKGSRPEKEARERGDPDAERLREREREKHRSSLKRGRRPTPSFSSDEEEDDEPPKRSATSARVPATIVKSKLAQSSSSKSAGQKATPALSTRAPAPSPPLPSEREELRRQYHTYYALYMGVTSKFYEQRAKIEAILAADGDSVSADDDVDMMDTEQLNQLRGEHDRLRDRLQEMLHAAKTMAY